MFIKVGGPGGAAAQRVNFGAVQTIQIVELHGRQRSGQRLDFLARFVEFAALVVGADDEHAHVESVRGFHRRPIQVVDKIPVEVDIVEFARIDRLENGVGSAVSGKADEAAAAFLCSWRAAARQPSLRRDQSSVSRLLMPCSENKST